MVIEYLVEKEIPTGLSKKSVVVLLTQDGAYRRFEHAGMPIEADVEELITAPVLAYMWNHATVISEKVYLDAQLRAARDYYTNILWQIEKQRRVSGTLDQALGLGLVAINNEPPDAFGDDAFAGYREWMELGTPQSIEEKRAALLLMQNFALIGLVRIQLLER